MGQARHFAVGPGEISCCNSTTGTDTTVPLQQEQGSVTLEPQLTNPSPLPSAVQGHADWKTFRGPWPRAALLLFIQLSVAASF